MFGNHTVAPDVRQFMKDNGCFVHEDTREGAFHDMREPETIDSLENQAKELDSRARVLRAKASLLRAEEAVKRTEERLKREEEYAKRSQTPSIGVTKMSFGFDRTPLSYEGTDTQDLFTQVTNDDRILNLDSQPEKGYIELIVQKPNGEKKKYIATVLTQKQLFEGHKMIVENRFNNGSGFTMWIRVLDPSGLLIKVYRFNTTQNTIDTVRGQVDQYF